MIFYPDRKFVGICGFISLAVSVILIFCYCITSSYLYLIASIVFFAITIYLIVPFLRNQIVETFDNHIIVYSFGNKVKLTLYDLTEIYSHGGNVNSYKFSKINWHYQITPKAYKDFNKMIHEFERLFHKYNNLIQGSQYL